MLLFGPSEGDDNSNIVFLHHLEKVRYCLGERRLSGNECFVNASDDPTRIDKVAMICVGQ